MPKGEEKPPTITGPSFILNNEGHPVLLEQVYDPETDFVGFALCRNGQVSVVDQYEHFGINILPKMDDGVKKGIILFPSKPVEYDTLGGLIEEIKKFINKWLDISPEFVEIATWYILLTWVHDMLNTITYLRTLGEFATGKSRFLDTIGGLCYRPINASGATTAAAVARLVETWSGTLLLNEADWEKSDEKQEIVRILNEGFERRRAVIKAHQDKQKDLIYYNVFGPKILAARRNYDDPALESRCLTEVMEETKRADISPILTKEFFEEQLKLRNKLLMFRFRFREKVNEGVVERIYPILLKKRIERRLIQATITFAVLFADDEELFGRFVSFLEKYQRELREDRAGTIPGIIVNVIFKLGSGGDIEIHPEKIASHFHDFGWVGDPPNPRTIGKYLRAFKITTKNRRVDGKVVKAIEWNKEQLNRILNLIEKYVPDYDKCSVEAFVACVSKAYGITYDIMSYLEGASVSSNPLATNATLATTLQNRGENNATNATHATPVEYVMVETLQEIPYTLVGADGRSYGPFDREKVTRLPRPNAVVLQSKGMVKILKKEEVLENE